MLGISNMILSVTNFRRNTGEFLKQLKATARSRRKQDRLCKMNKSAGVWKDKGVVAKKSIKGYQHLVMI
jgi:hypothetical protein